MHASVDGEYQHQALTRVGKRQREVLGAPVLDGVGFRILCEPRALQDLDPACRRQCRDETGRSLRPIGHDALDAARCGDGVHDTGDDSLGRLVARPEARDIGADVGAEALASDGRECAQRIRADAW